MLLVCLVHIASTCSNRARALPPPTSEACTHPGSRRQRADESEKGVVDYWASVECSLTGRCQTPANSKGGCHDVSCVSVLCACAAFAAGSSTSTCRFSIQYNTIQFWKPFEERGWYQAQRCIYFLCVCPLFAEANPFLEEEEEEETSLLFFSFGCLKYGLSRGSEA